ncbi:MAG: hypothetical protein ABI718_13730 [Acidobacteriota bacterium]
MTCERFLELVSAGPVAHSVEFLDHLRQCPNCLDRAVHADPDLLFRAIGGADLVPPGGVDAFVGEVMQQVHVRQTEQQVISRRRLAAPIRWSIAAVLAMAVGGTAVLYRPAAVSTNAPLSVARLQQPATMRPVVENYANTDATIVQLPAGNDLQVVMIFDDKLPADL